MAKDVIGTQNGQDFYVGQPDAAGAPAVDSSKGAGAGTAIATPPAKTLADAVLEGRNLLGTIDQNKSQSQYTIPAIIEETKKSTALARGGIEAQFGGLISDAKALGTQEKGGAVDDTARFRGEGFSTAAIAYMDSVQKKGEKRIQDLESAKAAALTNLDVQSAQRIQDLMLKEIDRQDKLQELRFNQMISVIGVGLQLKDSARADAQFDYTKSRDLKMDQKEARQFAMDNNIKGPGYELGGTWYSSTTGEAFPDEASAAKAGLNSSNVMHLDPGSKETRAYLQSLASTYVDAGIDWNSDTIQTATEKVKKNSAIYREKVRPPSSGGGGSAKSTYADLKAERDYVKSTVPSGIQSLAATGKSWGEVAKIVVDQGFDPGEFDDVFHRTYDSPGDYTNWLNTNTQAKKGAIGGGGNGITVDPDGTVHIGG